MVKHSPALFMKTTGKILITLAMLFLAGCASDEETKQFLKHYYKTSDVSNFKINNDVSRWFVRTKTGEVLIVFVDENKIGLYVEKSETIFQSMIRNDL